MNIPSDLVILVAEDHGFQRRMIVRMLHALGVQKVLEAADGKQALALIQEGALINLVVCDLDMPEMDGMEFIRHLGETSNEIAVIILSAKEESLLATVEKMTNAYNVKLLGVIEKPASLDQLNALIVRYKPPKARLKTILVADLEFSLEQILHGIQQKQFEPFFQPQVALATGRISGAEALARWCHPEKGLISPGAFVSILEQSGNIDRLTMLMLEKAASACRNWRECGFEITVSVNLSLTSLADPNIADRITQVVRATGLDPSHITLEITETASLTESAAALENLSRLRMRGFGLAVDDYGTGFSSLRQLTRAPFTELKIDRSFVTNCATNPSARTIVESSVEMARRLNIKTIAEGIETQADWDILEATNCDMAQGYFIARPMNESLFLEFCATKSERGILGDQKAVDLKTE